MSVRRIKAGTTDVSVTLRIVDSTDGTPETGVVFDTAGIDLWYRREGAASTDITEATLAALTTAHTDGGFLHINDGWYRLDLPDAACASGVAGVQIGGTVTGMVVLAPYIELPVNTAEDVYTRIGAPAGASVSADIAAIEAQTDDIGAAGAGLTAIPWNAAWDAEVQSEVADALAVYDPPTGAELVSEINAVQADIAALNNLSAADLGIHETTIATLASQTSFTLTAGSADDDAYNGWAIQVVDQSTSTQVSLGIVSDYTGATKTVTMLADPGIFTVATGDTVILQPSFMTTGVNVTAIEGADPSDTIRDAVVDDATRIDASALNTLSAGGVAPTAGAIADAVWEEAIADHSGTAGSTAEALNAAGSAGDPWVTALPGAYSAGQAGYIVGTNVNATVSSRASQTSVDDLPTNAELATALGTADDAVLAAIAALNNLSSAQAQTAAAAALTAYDPPTRAEATSDANSILTAVGDVPTNAELTTALAAADDAVLAAIAALNNVSVANILAATVEGSTTLVQSLRLLNSALGGKANGLETTTVHYRDLADTKDRILATVDADGNRSAVTLDLT